MVLLVVDEESKRTLTRVIYSRFPVRSNFKPIGDLGYVKNQLPAFANPPNQLPLGDFGKLIFYAPLAMPLGFMDKTGDSTDKNCEYAGMAGIVAKAEKWEAFPGQSAAFCAGAFSRASRASRRDDWGGSRG